MPSKRPKKPTFIIVALKRSPKHKYAIEQCGRNAPWTQTLKLAVLNEWAANNGASFNVSRYLTDADRCHRTPSKAIRRVVYAFLVATISKAKLDQFALTLIGNNTDVQQKWGLLVAKLVTAQKNYSKGTYQDVKDTLKKMTSAFNFLYNAVENVSIGNKTINQVQVNERNDFNVEKFIDPVTQKRMRRLTPKSKRQLEFQENNPDAQSGFKGGTELSKNDGRTKVGVYSSIVRTDKNRSKPGGLVSFDKLEPDSLRLIMAQKIK